MTVCDLKYIKSEIALVLQLDGGWCAGFVSISNRKSHSYYNCTAYLLSKSWSISNRKSHSYYNYRKRLSTANESISNRKSHSYYNLIGFVKKLRLVYQIGNRTRTTTEKAGGGKYWLVYQIGNRTRTTTWYCSTFAKRRVYQIGNRTRTTTGSNCFR